MKKQFIPVPEYLTALGESGRGEPAEHELYDVIGNGGCAFFVASDDTDDIDDLKFYITDGCCNGGFDRFMFTVPTIYCRECRQRMYVDSIPLDDPEYVPVIFDVTYSCKYCGLKYSKKCGWHFKRR